MLHLSFWHPWAHLHITSPRWVVQEAHCSSFSPNFPTYVAQTIWSSRTPNCSKINSTLVVNIKFRRNEMDTTHKKLEIERDLWVWAGFYGLCPKPMQSKKTVKGKTATNELVFGDHKSGVLWQRFPQLLKLLHSKARVLNPRHQIGTFQLLLRPVHCLLFLFPAYGHPHPG